MKQNLSAPRHAPSLHAEALQGHWGLRVAAHLGRGSEALPHDLTERLRFARERAVAVARQRHLAAAAVPGMAVVAGAGRAATLAGGPPPLWLRLASVLPLAVLVAGLAYIQLHYEVQQIKTAAEIDSALLADDLPPAAYGDPGFSEYLRSTAAP